MDIFASKNVPDDTINRIVELESIVKRLDELESKTNSKRIDYLDNLGIESKIKQIENKLKKLDGLESNLIKVDD